MAPFGNLSLSTIQPSSMRRSGPNTPSSASLVLVDLLAKAAASAERKAEELELIGRGSGAVGKQFEALLPHVRVLLVGQQLNPVVERPHRRHQVMAKPGT